jgi:hypothetical protein
MTGDPYNMPRWYIGISGSTPVQMTKYQDTRGKLERKYGKGMGNSWLHSRI